MSSVQTCRRFEGSVVLITGAGRGIGRGTAMQFAREGAHVAVLDCDESASQVAHEILGAGGSAYAIVADLANPEHRAAIIPRVLAESNGRLDVLVNNAAALGPRVPLTGFSDSDVREVMEVNLIAPLLLCRDALPHLTLTKGCIVMLSSIQFHLPLATFVSYVATKGGLEGITRALSVEMAGTGVRINAVAPGAVESPSMRVQWEAATGSTSAPPAPTLTGQWGTDQNIAEVVTFLCSPAAAYISGEVIRADGGRLLSRDADALARKQ